MMTFNICAHVIDSYLSCFQNATTIFQGNMNLMMGVPPARSTPKRRREMKPYPEAQIEYFVRVFRKELEERGVEGFTC